MIHKLPAIKFIAITISLFFLIAIIIPSSGCNVFQEVLTKMNMHPELVKRGEGSPGPQKCGNCHIDIYNEWAKSFHASSYTSEEFRASTNDYEFKFCLGCHVPETVFTSSKNGPVSETSDSITKFTDEEIIPRTHNLEEGVDCQSCHLTMDCKLAGPHSGISPHPIQKEDKLYLKSDFCGKCHIDTFKEYIMYTNNDDDKTCQDCHMPTVDRKLIQDEPWQKLHIKKEGKAHTFSSSDALKNNEGFLEMSFTGIKYKNNQIEGILAVENTMHNHSIPTGRYGYRELLLLINLKNSMGNIIKSKQESMFVELETQLKPNEKRLFPFTFDVEGIFINKENYELGAVLYKTDFNRENRILLAEVELKVGKRLDDGRYLKKK